jgi:hypothetical protein
MLHTLIVSPPNYFPVANQHGTYGNSARRQSFFCFLNRRLKKCVHAFDSSTSTGGVKSKKLAAGVDPPGGS